jgi:hypothetical protein
LKILSVDGEGVGAFEQGGCITVRLMIGYVFGVLAVSLIVFSIWDTAKGGGEGMVPLLVGFAMLLAAAGALRSSETRV